MFGRNNDGDQAELLDRRMEQYEQTLRVMYQRITESRSHQHALGFNYEQLMVSHRIEIGQIIEGLYSGDDNVGRERVLADTPSILAMSLHLKSGPSQSPRICSSVRLTVFLRNKTK